MIAIEIVIQLLIGLYSLQHLVREGMDEWLGVVLIAIHLILYLSTSIVQSDRGKMVLKGVNVSYLVGSILAGVPILFIYLIAIGSEIFLTTKKVVMQIIVATSLGFIGYHIGEGLMIHWLVVMLIVLINVLKYQTNKEVVSLKQGNLELMDKVYQLHKQVEAISTSKEEIAYMTKINERNSIANKLHDQLGHALAGNIMQLEVVKLIVAKDPEKSVQMLEAITTSLRKGMDDIRAVLKVLKPDVEQHGIAKIKEILLDLEEGRAIKTTLYYTGDLSAIDLLRWQVIGANLKEASTNFIKHSKGRRLDVVIEVLNQIIKVQIKDDGKVEQVGVRGIGVQGMDERTTEAGGRLVINTDKGFEVLMIFRRENHDSTTYRG